MELDKIKRLEELLKELHEISVYPYFGETVQKWEGDQIVTHKYTPVGKVVKRNEPLKL